MSETKQSILTTAMEAVKAKKEMAAQTEGDETNDTNTARKQLVKKAVVATAVSAAITYFVVRQKRSANKKDETPQD
jgi:hypothetical protein